MSVLSEAGVRGEVVGFSVFRGRRIYDVRLDRFLGEEEFERFYRVSVARGYQPLQLVGVGGGPWLRFIELPRGRGVWLVVLLLAATFATVWLTGLAFSQGYVEVTGLGLSPSVMATIYALLFLAVLGSHELGHLAASWRYGVPVSGPYFIPAPPAQLGFIGSLGSVISMRGLPPSRRSLALIGISGPIAGFLAGLVVGLAGVYFSALIPASTAAELAERGMVEEVPYAPLALALLLDARGVPPGYTIVVHPVAFVAFIIFMVTYLNLMPIGQLDGGHVVRSYVSARTHSLVGYAAIAANIAVGAALSALGLGGAIYLAIGFVLVFFKLLFGRGDHPGPANALSRMRGGYRLIILLYIALLALTAPVPLV